MHECVICVFYIFGDAQVSGIREETSSPRQGGGGGARSQGVEFHPLYRAARGVLGNSGHWRNMGTFVVGNLPNNQLTGETCQG